jgi:hypothetical protein
MAPTIDDDTLMSLVSVSTPLECFRLVRNIMRSVSPKLEGAVRDYTDHYPLARWRLLNVSYDHNFQCALATSNPLPLPRPRLLCNG